MLPGKLLQSIYSSASETVQEITEYLDTSHSIYITDTISDCKQTMYWENVIYVCVCAYIIYKEVLYTLKNQEKEDKLM